MRIVAIPEDKFGGTGLTFALAEGSPVASFTYPRPDPKKPLRVVNVATDGTQLRFFPERSSAQAILLNDLGLSTP